MFERLSGSLNFFFQDGFICSFPWHSCLCPLPHLYPSPSDFFSSSQFKSGVVHLQWTLNLQTAWLTDFSSSRLLWLQNLGSTYSQRIDLQTRKKPKWNKNGTKTAGYGLIGFQCIVGQWRLDLQTFWPAATIPIQINSVSRGSTVANSLWLHFYHHRWRRGTYEIFHFIYQNNLSYSGCYAPWCRDANVLKPGHCFHVSQKD